MTKERVRFSQNFRREIRSELGALTEFFYHVDLLKDKISLFNTRGREILRKLIIVIDGEQRNEIEIEASAVDFPLDAINEQFRALSDKLESLLQKNEAESIKAEKTVTKKEEFITVDIEIKDVGIAFKTLRKLTSSE